MTDNVAILAGYTEEYVAEAENGTTLQILARPGNDFDSRFKVWDMDEQEYIWLNGWLFSFEMVKRHA